MSDTQYPTLTAASKAIKACKTYGDQYAALRNTKTSHLVAFQKKLRAVQELSILTGAQEQLLAAIEWHLERR